MAKKRYKNPSRWKLFFNLFTLENTFHARYEAFLGHLLALSGNPEFRISENPDFRKSGNRISGNPEIRISGFLDFRHCVRLNHQPIPGKSIQKAIPKPV